MRLGGRLVAAGSTTRGGVATAVYNGRTQRLKELASTTTKAAHILGHSLASRDIVYLWPVDVDIQLPSVQRAVCVQRGAHYR